MIYKTLAAAAALMLLGAPAFAQGTAAQALQVAASQNACGNGATPQSATFTSANTIRVECLRVGGGGDLGGSLSATGAIAAGVAFVVIIASVGGDSDGGGSSSTTGT